MIPVAALALAALGALALAARARPAMAAAPGRRAAAVRHLAEQARRAGAGRLLPLAVAQAMLETGYGRAVPGQNWYGIKGRGPAGVVNVPTREEFAPGVVTRLRANFRAYNSAADSVRDYLRFITSGQYAPAAKMSPGGAALWIWAMGYATASNYPAALAAVSASSAKLAGNPALRFTLSSAQATLAAELRRLPAGRARRAAAHARRGQWPT